MDSPILLIGLALVFDFLNGFHDSSNIVATIISSRAMTPRMALAMTAAAELVGPFLFGLAVAETIGAGIIDPSVVTAEIILASLVGSIFWNLFTWFFGIPSSSSHALVGGLIGAAAASIGLGEIQSQGLLIVLASLFFSPLIGLAAGYLLTRLIYFLARNATLRINNLFKKGQIITGIALALGQGTNDAQKAMGIITLSLVVTGELPEFEVPFWVVAASAAAISFGTAMGGWRLIRTLGGKFYKIRPLHGFSTQLSSALVVLGAGLMGGPVSTTQVVSSAILGVGAAERVSMVRWNAAGNIIIAWLLTIPVTGLISALVYLLMKALS